MEKEYFYKLYYKGTKILYYSGRNIIDVLLVYQTFSYRKDLDFRIVIENFSI